MPGNGPAYDIRTGVTPGEHLGSLLETPRRGNLHLSIAAVNAWLAEHGFALRLRIPDRRATRYLLKVIETDATPA